LRLHNFIITHDGTYDLPDKEQDIDNFQGTDLGYFESRLNDADREEGGHGIDELMCLNGVSILRQHIRDEITANGHVRPHRNVERNA
jgi:hypothetical protein